MSIREQRPAILGGTPTFPDGPPPWPLADAEIQQALEASFQTGTWGVYCGPKHEELEHLLQSHFHAQAAYTCASGTLAVEVALRTVGVTAGDEVILAGYEYEPNFLTVHHLGATPVLVDIQKENAVLNIEKVIDSISPRTKAILATHLHGGLVDMPRLKQIATTHRIPLLEDFCQAVGGQIDGQPCGSFGDLSVLSFGGSKSLSAGRGGGILVPNPEYVQRCKLILNRGVQQWACLSELQAAVLIPQLQKLAQRTQTRWQAVQRLRNLLQNLLGLKMFEHRPHDLPAFYKVGFWFDETQFGLTRSQFLKAARAEGIALSEGFRALHIGRSPKRYRSAHPLSLSEKANHSIVILHHPVLLADDPTLQKLAQALERIYHYRDEIQATL